MFRTVVASAWLVAVIGFSHSALGATENTDSDTPQERPSYTFEGLPEPGELRRYKNHLLVGSAKKNANNAKFFIYMAKVIDLAEQLPKDLRKGVDLIHLIAYDPPDSTQPQAADTNDRIIETGEYRFSPDTQSMGAFVVTRDVTWIPPIKVAYAFVDASLTAKLHRNLLTLSEKLKYYERGSAAFHKLDQKFQLINGLLNKTDADAMAQFQCEPLRARYEAMRAWDDDKERIESLRRRMVSAKCSFKS